MTSRPLVILGLFIIMIAVIAAAGYFMNGQGGSAISYGNPASEASPAPSPNMPAGVSSSFYQSPTSTPDGSAVDDGTAVSAAPAEPAGQDDQSATTTIDVPFPASTTVDTSSWIPYSDDQSGYSLEYPSDVVEGASGGVLSLVFPSDAFFHWPLLDTAQITVTPAPSCQPIADAGGPGAQGPASFALNGYTFVRTIGSGASAGERYLEVAYDTQSAGECYHIDFLDRGADGASSLVDDLSLDQTYDAQHDADLSGAVAVLDGVVSTFHLLAPGH